MHDLSPKPAIAPTRRWSLRSIAILVLTWLILQIGGLFSPGLLDDVDSIYIEIAREMLRRHDFVTPYINGVRFFDKPPLMYWMAAASMRLFGPYDWAARLPLALAVLALLLAVYGLGIRLFADLSPSSTLDRGGFYAALALATSIGPYLYTRFYIPDILLALWMTLAVHLFLIALDRINQQSRRAPQQNWVPHPLRLLQRVGYCAPARPFSSIESSKLAPDTGIPHLRDSFISSNLTNPASDPRSSPSPEGPGVPSFASFAKGGIVNSSPLLPCLAFAAVMAANVLTKGLIGLVFPIAFVLLYLAFTRQLRLLPKLHLLSSAAVFLALAAPWHILAAIRTPPIALPSGMGLPATGGWAWFYLYNEHIARFLGKRIPHDYGQVPVPLFWLLSALWIMPWAIFLPSAISRHIRDLRQKTSTAPDTPPIAPGEDSEHPNSPGAPSFAPFAKGGVSRTSATALLQVAVNTSAISRHIRDLRQKTSIAPDTPPIAPGADSEHPNLPGAPSFAPFAKGGVSRTSATALLQAASNPAANTSATSPPPQTLSTPTQHEAALSLLLWTTLVLGFFTLSSRQEYYNLPALPALALMAAGLLARADVCIRSNSAARKSAIAWSLFFLVPLTTLIAVVCGYFAFNAPRPAPGADIASLLAANPAFYNLSLGHLFDLTGAAMGLFRGPLAAVALGMLATGLGSYLLRRAGRTYAANLVLAASTTVILLAAHEGLARFYPILGSKQLALAIDQAQQADPGTPGRPSDLIILDGELTSGSTLVFYTRQQVHLVNGHVNGLWYGSFWPDSPKIFESEASLHQLWSSPRRIFLFTYNPDARARDLNGLNPVHLVATAGGKTILTNH